MSRLFHRVCPAKTPGCDGRRQREGGPDGDCLCQAMTPDPKPGAPVRLTDEQLKVAESLCAPVDSPWQGLENEARALRLLPSVVAEARRARESEEAKSQLLDTYRALLDAMTKERDAFEKELSVTKANLSDRATDYALAMRERDAAVKRADEAEQSRDRFKQWFEEKLAYNTEIQIERDTLNQENKALADNVAGLSVCLADARSQLEKEKNERHADGLEAKEWRLACVAREKDLIAVTAQLEDTNRVLTEARAEHLKFIETHNFGAFERLRSELKQTEAALDTYGESLRDVGSELQAARDRIGALEGLLSPRVEDLARRLVMAGPKAAHVSASETHEISDAILNARAALAPAPGAVPTREHRHTFSESLIGGPCLACGKAATDCVAETSAVPTREEPVRIGVDLGSPGGDHTVRVGVDEDGRVVALRVTPDPGEEGGG